MIIEIINDNALYNDYLNLLSENAFASFIDLYTRLPNGQKHSCLDHIISHNEEHLITLTNRYNRSFQNLIFHTYKPLFDK